ASTRASSSAHVQDSPPAISATRSGVLRARDASQSGRGWVEVGRFMSRPSPPGPLSQPWERGDNRREPCRRSHPGYFSPLPELGEGPGVRATPTAYASHLHSQSTSGRECHPHLVNLERAGEKVAGEEGAGGQTAGGDGIGPSGCHVQSERAAYPGVTAGAHTCTPPGIVRLSC